MNRDAEAGPLAFNTARMTWPDLPDDARERVAALAGADVVTAHGTSTGFSPGFAGGVHLADGRRVFVKATSEVLHPWSVEFARAEILANAVLPESLPAPRLLWSNDGPWTLAGFEFIDGGSPALPRRAHDLNKVLNALTNLAAAEPLPGHHLRPIAEAHADMFSMWAEFGALPHRERHAAALRGGPWGEWAMRHLDALVGWESEAAAVCAGDSLVHGDLRADNVVLDAHERVWMVDWPHVSTGAPWLDLAFLLPSVAMQGGGEAHEHFRSHALGALVSYREIRAMVTVITGYFMLNSWQDTPEHIPTLRAFQAGQALSAARWLQALEPSLD